MGTLLIHPEKQDVNRLPCGGRGERAALELVMRQRNVLRADCNRLLELAREPAGLKA